MPNTFTLPLDLTGRAPANRISGEIHTLTTLTGRCVALNYGGFYTDSLVIRDPNTNTTLTPTVDYVCVGPYDDITRQTGLNACVIVVFLLDDWRRIWEINYSAVGGQYSTNVQTVRDVIDTMNVDPSAVRWGDIVDVPSQFETAPHLIDFRTQLFGFEGLIDSLRSITERLTPMVPAESAVLMTQVQQSIAAIQSTMTQSLNAMQQQINGLQIPSVAGLLSGTPATDEQIRTMQSTDAYLRASNIMELARRGSFAAQHLTDAALLDTTTLPLVSGLYDLRANNKGDNTVTAGPRWYMVETRWFGNNADLNSGSSIQIAYDSDNNAVLSGVFRRRRNSDGTVTQWTRIDARDLRQIDGLMPKATTANMGTWADPSNNHAMTPSSTKGFLKKFSGEVLPVGSVMMWSGTNRGLITNSDSWRLCEGQAMSRSELPELNTAYGGGTNNPFRDSGLPSVDQHTQTTTIKLPDLRGVVVRGWDNRTTGNRDPDRGRVFGNYQSDAVQKMVGNLTTIKGGGISGPAVTASGVFAVTSGSGAQGDGGDRTGVNITFDASRVVSTSAYETRMRNVSMHFIIKIR